MARENGEMEKILIIEPTWGKTVHLPFIQGTLKVVLLAYPDAEINFIGDSEQIDLLKKGIGDGASSRITFIPWQTYRDTDTTPGAVLKRGIRLIKATFRQFLNADSVVLTSATGPFLSALHIINHFSRKNLQIFLHGDYNDVHGWRSRNPLRRAGDLHASLKRVVGDGAQILVLEEHIKEKARTDLPWLYNSLEYFPHPRIECEAVSAGKALEFPLRIGLAGISSPDKGFCHFLQLAELVKENGQRKRYTFHAIGKRHPSNSPADCERLDTPPALQQLSRAEYLTRLDSMHFLFFWPTGDYYTNASSGVFYDAINRKIPLITSTKLKNTHPEISSFALLAEKVEEIPELLKNLDETCYQQYQEALSKYAERFSECALAQRYREINNKVAAELGDLPIAVQS
jgi:hypothetical protein